MSLYITVYYDEIGLKGKNKPYFEKKLQHNLKIALKNICNIQSKTLLSRIILKAEAKDKWPEIVPILQCTFGIAHFERMWKTPADMDKIAQKAFEILPDTEGISFKVKTTRSDKSYPIKSPEINKVIGASIQKDRNWKVDLTNPDVTFFISIIGKHAFLACEKIPGAGGLPIGVSGKVVCLLSGGIDSPVAAHKLMRRGSLPVFVHFHSYPFTGKSSQERAIRTVRKLLFAQPKRPLWLVPLGEIQQQIVEKSPTELRILLYRRFMFRVAEKIALKEKAQALVTGEALGQVASQTIENMAAVEDSVSLPVLRPLVGFDKKQIIKDAKKIETFNMCTCGEDDCCSYLLPPKVSTHSTAAELSKAEANLPVQELIYAALENSERKILDFN